MSDAKYCPLERRAAVARTLRTPAHEVRRDGLAHHLDHLGQPRTSVEFALAVVDTMRMAPAGPDRPTSRALAHSIRNLLGPGEEVRYAFRAVSGRRVPRLVSAWKMFGDTSDPIKPVLYALGVRTYIVAVTNTSVLIAQDRLQGYQLVARLPRATRIGPFLRNGWVQLGGLTLCLPDVEGLEEVRDADAEMGYDEPGSVSTWFGRWRPPDGSPMIALK